MKSKCAVIVVCSFLVLPSLALTQQMMTGTSAELTARSDSLKRVADSLQKVNPGPLSTAERDALLRHNDSLRLDALSEAMTLDFELSRRRRAELASYASAIDSIKRLEEQAAQASKLLKKK